VSGPRQVDFERPPVTETVLGVQFAPLRALTLPYFGLFWEDIRDRYPGHEVKPPLSPVEEDFSQPPKPTRLSLEVSSELDARCWFIDQTTTKLIQLQRDRFIRNWRKGPPPHDGYPRYAALRPEFESDWQGFIGFLDRERLGAPEVNQCEVSYINHIELGHGWQSLAETHRVLRMLRPLESPSFLSDPEAVILNARFVMPERRGRMHVSASPAIRRADGQQVLQLTLTARGRPESSRLEDLVLWFDQGHDWIVRGFVDLTTPELHAIWGRQR
jgi:uncharacterized protein (TIGR04255 family)